jgi:hypothetical protein
MGHGKYTRTARSLKGRLTAASQSCPRRLPWRAPIPCEIGVLTKSPANRAHRPDVPLPGLVPRQGVTTKPLTDGRSANGALAGPVLSRVVFGRLDPAQGLHIELDAAVSTGCRGRAPAVVYPDVGPDASPDLPRQPHGLRVGDCVPFHPNGIWHGCIRQNDAGQLRGLVADGCVIHARLVLRSISC